MPPPQHLLSPKERLLLARRCSSWLSCTLLPLLLLLFLLPLSAPSTSSSTSSASSSSSQKQKTPSSSSSSSATWAPNNHTHPHWSIPDEEVCPSARAWVVRPGSFCTTLWTSPYLSNQTELEARERRAVQIYCELDVILERFDCGQEYSVNVRRGQCQLCRQAYREWVCAVVADTADDGSLDCTTKLMPCPSCASICHQVMRLCPYLSPDRMQFDLNGQSLPQVSQYGGHPAFFCPLENDDPSDPAYTSLCFKPYAEDPDHVHNLCTNPPLGHHYRTTARSRRSHNHDNEHHPDYNPDHHTTESPYSNSYEYDTTDWSTSTIPLHYTTCCWTYASSLVIFDPSKEYPNYGSDAFFSTTLQHQYPLQNVTSIVPTSKIITSSKETLTPSTPSTTISKFKATFTSTTTTTTIPPPLTSSAQTNSTQRKLPLGDDESNRIILNCCDSLGDCNAIDGEIDFSGNSDTELGSSLSGSASWNPVEEIKSDVVNKLSIKNRKRSSERIGGSSDGGGGRGGGGISTGDQDEDEDLILEEDKELENGSGSSLLDSTSSSSSSSPSSGSSSPSSPAVLSLPSLFFKTIDSPNPTHISELEDIEYDDHYLDTEPDLESSAGSTEVEEEEEEEDEDQDEEVDDLLRQVKKKLVSGGGDKVVTDKPGRSTAASSTSSTSSSSSSSSSISTNNDKKSDKVIQMTSRESEERVHYEKQKKKKTSKGKKNAFMSIVIRESDSGTGDEHVLDRDHHSSVPKRRTNRLLRNNGGVLGGGSESEPSSSIVEQKRRTKKRRAGDEQEVEEEMEDESFTFVDNTLSHFLPESENSDNTVRNRQEKDNMQVAKHHQHIYYYARHSAPSSATRPQLFLFTPLFSLLSPTYLISAAVFTIRMWWVVVDTFIVVVVAVLLLLLLFLLFVIIRTTTTTSSAGVTTTSTAALIEIFWSFLPKTNFLSRRRTRTSRTKSSSSGGGSRSKKCCVHTSPKEEVETDDREKAEEDEERNGCSQITYFILWSQLLQSDRFKLTNIISFKARLTKLLLMKRRRWRRSCCSTRVVHYYSKKKRRFLGDGYYYWNNDNNNNYTTNNELQQHLYNSNYYYISASVQSSFVDFKRLKKATRTINSTALLLLMIANITTTTTQQEQDYFYYYLLYYDDFGYYYYSSYYDNPAPIRNSGGSGDGDGGCCGRVINDSSSCCVEGVDCSSSSSRQDDEDDNNCSSRGRRKRRRKASVIYRVRSNFKEIFRDFLLDFHDKMQIFPHLLLLSPPCMTTSTKSSLLLLLLYQLDIEGVIVVIVEVVFNFKFLTFTATTSKSLTLPLRLLLLLIHARLIVASKIYNVNIILQEFRISSNYYYNCYNYSTTIKANWRKCINAVKEEAVVDSSSPSNKNEAIPPSSSSLSSSPKHANYDDNDHPIHDTVVHAVWVLKSDGIDGGGGHSSSQCGRTKFIILKITLKIKFVEQSPSPAAIKSITIIMLRRMMLSIIMMTCNCNNTNKFLVQFLQLVVKHQKPDYYYYDEGLRTMLSITCCQTNQKSVYSFLQTENVFRKFCPTTFTFSRKRKKILWFRVEFVLFYYYYSSVSIIDLRRSLLVSLLVCKRLTKTEEEKVVERPINEFLALLLLLLLCGLRGQSKSRIGLLQNRNHKNFKVYARATLKLLRDGESTIKKPIKKSYCCYCHCRQKSNTSNAMKLRWCSHKAEAAGFEIHPLIKLATENFRLEIYRIL